MGHWRFRRSAKIFPGVRINFNKNSTSITIGGRGVKTTINSHGIRHTVGLPGTGASYTDYKSHGNCQTDNANSGQVKEEKLWVYLLGIFSMVGWGIISFIPSENMIGEKKNAPGCGIILFIAAGYFAVKAYNKYSSDKSNQLELAQNSNSDTDPA